MRTREFVRSLKYDAVPRTTVPIEPFNRVVALTFDTTHATESQHMNYTEYVVMARLGPQSAMERPCQTEPDD